MKGLSKQQKGILDNFVAKHKSHEIIVSFRCHDCGDLECKDNFVLSLNSKPTHDI